MAGRIARWDGQQWQTFRDLGECMPERLTLWNGRLCVAGWARSGGGRVLRLNGQVWEQLPGEPVSTLAMAVYNGCLMVGGYGVQDGSVYYPGMAAWDGQRWYALGWAGDGTTHSLGSYAVNAVGTHNGELLAGANIYPTDDGERCRILRQTDDGWQPMGEDLLGDSRGTWISTFVPCQGGLIVAGRFAYAGDLACNGIVRWDGSRWVGLGQGVSYWRDSTGEFVPGSVRAVLEYNGDLIAGGYFDRAGQVASPAVARWDGMRWHAMGAGLTGTYYPDPFGNLRYDPPEVEALAIYEGQVIAGGRFLTEGSQAYTNVARWDGQRWQPLGTGVTADEFSIVSSLAVHGGRLIAAGRFTRAGDVSCDSVAAWDGDRWHAMSGPTTYPGHVYALTVYGGELIAAGTFRNTRQSETWASVSRWDGQQGQPLSTGTNASVYSMTVHDGDLVVAGGFNVAGMHVSRHVARWGPACVGDVNDDGQIDLADLMKLVEAFGAQVGEEGYLPLADFDGDGTISVLDIVTMIRNLPH